MLMKCVNEVRLLGKFVLALGPLVHPLPTFSPVVTFERTGHESSPRVH